MARLVRYQQCGCFHFVTLSCYRRQPLLDTATAYRTFEQEFEAVRARYGLAVAGYVLMPEHVHLLVGEPNRSSLSVVLQVLKQNTSRKLKPPGAVQFWQRRYYDFNVWSEEKRVEKLRYMHCNPVVRGLVKRPEARRGRDRIAMDSIPPRQSTARTSPLRRNGRLRFVLPTLPQRTRKDRAPSAVGECAKKRVRHPSAH